MLCFANGKIIFFNDSVITLFIYTHIYPLSVNGHLRCSHIEAIINNAAVKIGVYVYSFELVFIFFGYIPRGEYAG